MTGSGLKSQLLVVFFGRSSLTPGCHKYEYAMMHYTVATFLR